MEIDEAAADFARRHEDADLAQLMLSGTPPGIDAATAAEQIQARRKARHKLPEWHAAPGVVMPPPLSVEQASSAVTAAYKASLVTGERLVDLTGGMGADTLAFAERFDHTVYVEADERLCRLFAHNAARLSRRPIEVVNASAEAFLRDCRGTATFYLDPARRDAGGRRALRFESCRPDVTALLPALLEAAERVLVKASPMIDLSQGIRALGAVQEVHVVGVMDECREVLFLLQPGVAAEPAIHCVDLGHGRRHFRFDLSEERAAACRYAPPARYLYDPAGLLRKAGAFRTVAARFDLAKLAPNTHLYTADGLRAGFPGRVFEVIAPAGKHPRRLLPDGRANVMARNHPLGAEGLKSRYRLMDGGDHWLIGFRDAGNRARTVIARRVETALTSSE